MTNAERFLTAYAICEKQLSELAGQQKYVPFSQLLAKCSVHSRVVSLNQQSLREYNELRNAIVHIRGVEQEIIAEPSDSVTADIERIAKLLTEPNDILKYASMPVKTVAPSTSMRTAFACMQELGTSKIPVYEGQHYVGVLTLEEIAQAAVDGVLDDTSITDVVRAEKNERVVFVGRKNHVDVVFSCYDEAMKAGHTLLAIMITEHGKRSEKALGIITTADLPKILCLYR